MLEMGTEEAYPLILLFKLLEPALTFLYLTRSPEPFPVTVMMI